MRALRQEATLPKMRVEEALWPLGLLLARDMCVRLRGLADTEKSASRSVTRAPTGWLITEARWSM